MRQAIPQQHPAVVLRSTYRQLRALLAVALVALVGLTAAVVILANEENTSSTSSSSTASQGATRPGGGPEESGVAAAIAKGESAGYTNYWSPMPRSGANGRVFVPGQPTESQGRPDESKIASEIETGSVQPQTQPQPKVFQGPRFGGARTN
jgi:hypothetical protein